MSKATLKLIPQLLLYWVLAYIIGNKLGLANYFYGFMLFMTGYVVGGEHMAQGIEKELKRKFGGKDL